MKYASTSRDSNATGTDRDSKPKARSLLKTTLVVLAVAAHVPLGILFARYSLLSTAHSLLAVAVGLFLAIRGDVRSTLMALWYICVAETLWRMTDGNILWEYGKYAGIVVALTLALRKRLVSFRQPYHVVYLALLVPSVFAMPSIDFQSIRFNMSGPLCLAVFMILVQRIKLGVEEIEQTLAATIPPAVAIAAIASYSTLSADLGAINQSSYVTSGGFGPNQVSTAIGAGIFACLIIARRMRGVRRIGLIVLSLWLITQCMLTFSRGGIWTTGVALAVFSIGFLRSSESRRGVLLIAPVIAIVMYKVVVPTLNNLTEDRFSQRFSDVSSTGRYEMMMADLNAFIDYPILGLGPGGSMEAHARVYTYAASHTEQTRMLAEHGLLGAISLILLNLVVLFRCFDRRQSLESTYLKLSLAAWGFFYMLHAAFRTSLPGLMIAIGTSSPNDHAD